MHKGFLTQQEIITLRVQHEMEMDGVKADRIKAITLADEGYTYSEIAKFLYSDEVAVRHYVDDYIQSRNNKLNADQNKKLES
ncbi:MAG: hypothetical protein LBR89_04990 [Holosporales bacterium]|jgi:hypothetical protein|nr:hypothetical protein [Holosporales bacterium]